MQIHFVWIKYILGDKQLEKSVTPNASLEMPEMHTKQKNEYLKTILKNYRPINLFYSIIKQEYLKQGPKSV